MDDPTTPPAELLAQLRASIAAFETSARSLAPDAWLRRVTEWAPRDVAAHLVGWNALTLEGCQAIQRGAAPGYLAGEADDFQQVNATSVARYDALDRDTLLDQLRATADDLLAYLERLDLVDWDRDYGARGLSGRPATIRVEIEPLIADYRGHADEIAAWAQS
jgi:hypothetical protein